MDNLYKIVLGVNIVIGVSLAAWVVVTLDSVY